MVQSPIIPPVCLDWQSRYYKSDFLASFIVVPKAKIIPKTLSLPLLMGENICVTLAESYECRAELLFGASSRDIL
jgi:hypothetical protein